MLRDRRAASPLRGSARRQRCGCSEWHNVPGSGQQGTLATLNCVPLDNSGLKQATKSAELFLLFCLVCEQQGPIETGETFSCTQVNPELGLCGSTDV